MAPTDTGYTRPESTVAMTAESAPAPSGKPTSVMIEVADDGMLTVRCSHRPKGNAPSGPGSGDEAVTTYPTWDEARAYLDEKFGMTEGEEPAEMPEGPSVTEGAPYQASAPYLG